MNIVDPILFQCRRQPPAPAICVPGPGIGLISYRRFERYIHNVCRRLHALNLPERSIVAVKIEDTILHAVVLLAAMRMGIVTASLRGSEPMLPFEISALLVDSTHPLPQGGRIIRADLSWVEGDGRPLEPHHLPSTNENDLCRLILTSGTSNKPKAVPLSHKLLAGRMARHSTFGSRLANCSRIYCDVPISSSLGFQFLIHTLSRGGMAFFPGEDFTSTLRVIEDYGVECLIGSPGGFENLLRWFDTLPAYQSRIETVFCGGDVLSRPLSDRLRSRICRHLIAAYGSTEASMSAVAHAHEIADVPRAVGFVTPGVVVQIVNASGTLLPAGKEGQVRVRSQFAVDHYLGDLEESKKAFRDGWFYPGDLGTLREDGLLIITGREHAVLNVGGDKISPEAIELILMQFPGVIEAAALSLSNVYGNSEVCAVIVTREGTTEEALKSYCESRIPRPFTPTRIVFVDELPHNEMGKLDRGRLETTLRKLTTHPDPSS
jgi:acyl-coenzyme A synthetase/AMP-(fatty) acid ligase